VWRAWAVVKRFERNKRNKRRGGGEKKRGGGEKRRKLAIGPLTKENKTHLILST
jgi:hypothetical protein